MKRGTKILASGILVLICMITGCILLMRGCMAKHDEYSQFDEAQVFKNQNAEIMVFLKEHFKVTSYSSSGGVRHISGNSRYYLETRDVETLQLLKSTHFREIEDPARQRPEIVGSDNEVLWIFSDKITAFDPFTHQIVCTKEKLEELNAGLKNNLPDDVKYYSFNYISGNLEVTTKNALKFRISKSFKAQKINETESNETEEIIILKDLSKKLDSLRMGMLKNGKSSVNKDYWKLGDSIREIENIIRDKTDEIRNNKDYNQKIQEARVKGFNYAYDKLSNAAILDSTIFALLSDKELKDYSTNFYFRRIYSEDVQRSLYQAIYKDIYISGGIKSNCKVSEWKRVNNTISFLKGGFLENKTNLTTIELADPKSWLVITYKEVGDQSPLILQRVNTNGIATWTKELPIKDFSDLVFVGDNLVLFSNDGKKITGTDECNWIISINLENGDFVFLDLGEEES